MGFFDLTVCLAIFIFLAARLLLSVSPLPNLYFSTTIFSRWLGSGVGNVCMVEQACPLHNNSG